MNDLDFGVVARTWPYLMGGLQYTVQLTVVAAIGGTVFGTLLAGATLVLAPRERLLPDEPLRTLLTSQQITAVTLTPSVLAQLTDEGLTGLRTVISAGEALSP